MTNSDPRLKRFPDMAELADGLSPPTSPQTLARAIAARGGASLVVSGGKTPVKFFEQLRAQPLDWRRVCVALADERWVDPSDPGSNEKMVREMLLKDRGGGGALRGAQERRALAGPRRGLGLGDVRPHSAAFRRDHARHGR